MRHSNVACRNLLIEQCMKQIYDKKQQGGEKKLWIYFLSRKGKNWPWMNEWLTETTISARSLSLPRGSLCQWVDTVTVATSGRISMELRLRKWKCLWWLELGPPLSWSYVRMVAWQVGADLGQFGLWGMHKAQADGRKEKKKGGWWLSTAGAKVIKCQMCGPPQQNTPPVL